MIAGDMAESECSFEVLLEVVNGRSGGVLTSDKLVPMGMLNDRAKLSGLNMSNLTGKI